MNIWNKFAVYVLRQVFAWTYIFFSLVCISRSEIIGQFCLTLWEIAGHVSKWSPFEVYSSNTQKLLFLCIFAHYYLIMIMIDITAAFLVDMMWYVIAVLSCICLVINDAEYFFTSCWPYLCRLWRNIYSSPLSVVFLNLFIFIYFNGRMTGRDIKRERETETVTEMV